MGKCLKRTLIRPELPRPRLRRRPRRAEMFVEEGRANQDQPYPADDLRTRAGHRAECPAEHQDPAARLRRRNVVGLTSPDGDAGHGGCQEC
ncbi:hypothetical protein CSC28_2277 [Pseudomonas paraeruginosa]|nr:hypothetical protein CSC28_2277 [Pseudomonas paraeruginosa]